jgi:hypothetical protein
MRDHARRIVGIRFALERHGHSGASTFPETAALPSGSADRRQAS